MKHIQASNIICVLAAIFHFQNNAFAENSITGYRYDGLNRLLHTDMIVADELETTDTYLSPDAQVGDMTCYYDRIGNHKYQKRYGPYNDSGQPNNHLSLYAYYYEPGKSRLDFMNGYYQAPDRLYDLDYNGNVIKDEAHEIEYLRYNSNNLPTVMDNATYLYDGSDQRIVKDSGELETIYWRDNSGRELAIETNTNPPSIITTWQYNIHGNTLISHYSVPTTQYPDFDDIPLDPTPPAYTEHSNTDIASLTYYVTDHLGNTKLTFKTNACNAALSLESVIEYHPFGTKLREWNADESERYLFNGQERDVETGYDYFRYRMYDSEIARFNGVDPLSAKYPANSSYAFAENRVVNGVELEGLEYTAANIGHYRETNPVLYGFAKGLSDMWDGMVALTESETYERLAIVNMTEGLPSAIGGNIINTIKDIPNWDAADYSEAATELLVGWTFGEGLGYVAKTATTANSVLKSASLADDAGSRLNLLKPNSDAIGPHSTFKTGKSGTITNYTEYSPNPLNPSGFDEVKRVDLVGKAHFDKPTQTYIFPPNVTEKGLKGTRKARPEELPTSFRNEGPE